MVCIPGHITVGNEFKYDGTPGTLSHQSSKQSKLRDEDKPLIDLNFDSVSVYSVRIYSVCVYGVNSVSIYSVR